MKEQDIRAFRMYIYWQNEGVTIQDINTGINKIDDDVYCCIYKNPKTNERTLFVYDHGEHHKMPLSSRINYNS